MKKILLKSGPPAIVDNEFYKVLSLFKWHATGKQPNRYAQTVHKGETLSMHRMICDYPVGKVVHHKNGNGLDNRVGNLSVCTQAQHRHLHRKYPKGTVNLTFRISETLRADITRQNNIDEIGSESEMLIGLCKAYLQGEVVYKNYQFVAKEN